MKMNILFIESCLPTLALLCVLVDDIYITISTCKLCAEIFNRFGS